MTHAHRFSALVTVLTSLAGLACQARAEEPRVTVFCPAVAQDDHDEGYADVPESILPVALVVVGSLDPNTMTLQVDRTLFGPPLTEVKLARNRSGYLPKRLTKNRHETLGNVGISTYGQRFFVSL